MTLFYFFVIPILVMCSLGVIAVAITTYAIYRAVKKGELYR